MNWRSRLIVGAIVAGIAAQQVCAQTTAPQSAPSPTTQRSASTPGVSSEELTLVLTNAAKFVRAQRNDDGSFGAGRAQPHLQTAVATLALLSLRSPPSAEDLAVIEKAVAYLVKSAGSNGDMGDQAFKTESHAFATLAVMCSMQYLRDDATRTSALKVLSRALNLLRQNQDRSTSTLSRGGWKMEGTSGVNNDRRASAAALLCLSAARQFGLETRNADLERGVRFLLGSLKEKSDNADQIGGLSVDTEGLAVESISAMGGWAMGAFGAASGTSASAAKDRTAKNFAWLMRSAPEWTGPNYFYSNFFRVRAMKMLDPDSDSGSSTVRRLFGQLKDHQQADGSIALPPGTAQNEVTMGPLFSTAMSILLLDVEQSHLVFDEDWRLRPMF